MNNTPSSVIKEAGLGIPNIEELKNEIDRRGLSCKEAAYKDMYSSLSATLGVSTGGEIGATLDKLATVIDDLDNLSGLNKFYGNGITTPADFIYSTPFEKMAEEVDKTVKLGTFIFDVTKLAELPVESYSVLGEEFTDSIKVAGAIDVNKLRDGLNGLNQRDKYILEDSLKD